MLIACTACQLFNPDKHIYPNYTFLLANTWQDGVQSEAANNKEQIAFYIVTPWRRVPGITGTPPFVSVDSARVEPIQGDGTLVLTFLLYISSFMLSSGLQIADGVSMHPSLPSGPRVITLPLPLFHCRYRRTASCPGSGGQQDGICAEVTTSLDITVSPTSSDTDTVHHLEEGREVGSPGMSGLWPWQGATIVPAPSMMQSDQMRTLKGLATEEDWWVRTMKC